ncbi:MAG: hypothetical protein LBC03_06640 [Nitrososphaerota archaeon]|nr:hypothetical protein [Nitrososphaerota archaeon]
MMMKNKTKKSMISISIMLLLVVGCFAAVPQVASAADNGIRIEKTVNGVPFNDWLAGFPSDKQAEILSSISFELYAANGVNGVISYGTTLAEGTIDANGDIHFPNLHPDVRSSSNSWYAVVEHFEPDSLAAELFTNANPLYIHLHNGEITDFDYDAFYIIDNGYYQGCPNLNYVDDLNLLNQNGQFFPIHVINSETGQKYPSFCAHGGSERFAGDNDEGCTGYMSVGYSIVEDVDIADFISALNYIEDNIGVLADNRIVTQTVVWALLGAVDVSSSAWDHVTITPTQKADVEYVLANYKDYTGSNKIVDVAYLLCSQHLDGPTGLQFCQPQFVPVYGDPVFANTASPFVVPEYGLAGLAALATCFAALLVFYATKNRAKARTYNTNTIPTSI